MPRTKAITFRQLRALRSVAACGSMTRAGAELGLTPSAVHTQIRALESALRARVLLRSGAAGATLTPEGRAVLDADRQIEAILARCVETVRSLRAGQSGAVVLGVVSTGKYFAPHLVARLRRDHPDIDVVLRIGNREETLAALEERRIELVIMGRPPRSPAVVAHPLGPHPHVLIAAPGHPLAGRSEVPAGDLLRQTFITRESGSGTRILMSRYLDQIGEGRPYRQIEMGSNETIKQAVMADLGVALISLHTATEELRAGRLVLIDAPGLPIVRQWYLLHREDAVLSSAAETLVGAILGYGGSFLPEL
jgi:DNA-binding transcriptional LysR family regulator